MKCRVAFLTLKDCFCRISCNFSSSIKLPLFTKQHVVSVNFMDVLRGPERSHLSPKVAGVRSLSVMLVCSSQWMSSKFGCFVFLLQAGNAPRQFCSSTFCPLSLSGTHFYHEKASNQQNLFYLYVETSVLLMKKKNNKPLLNPRN